MQQKACRNRTSPKSIQDTEVMPKAESLLCVSLGSSPEGESSLGTIQKGIARCMRAVFQGSQN